MNQFQFQSSQEALNALENLTTSHSDVISWAMNKLSGKSAQTDPLFWKAFHLALVRSLSAQSEIVFHKFILRAISSAIEKSNGSFEALESIYHVFRISSTDLRMKFRFPFEAAVEFSLKMLNVLKNLYESHAEEMNRELIAKFLKTLVFEFIFDFCARQTNVKKLFEALVGNAKFNDNLFSNSLLKNIFEVCEVITSSEFSAYEHIVKMLLGMKLEEHDAFGRKYSWSAYSTSMFIEFADFLYDNIHSDILETISKAESGNVDEKVAKKRKIEKNEDAHDGDGDDVLFEDEQENDSKKNAAKKSQKQPSQNRSNNISLLFELCLKLMESSESSNFLKIGIARLAPELFKAFLSGFEDLLHNFRNIPYTGLGKSILRYQYELVLYEMHALLWQKCSRILLVSTNSHILDHQASGLHIICEIVVDKQLYHRNRDIREEQRKLMESVLKFCSNFEIFHLNGSLCTADILEIEHTVIESDLEIIFASIWKSYAESDNIKQLFNVLLHVYSKLNQLELILTTYISASLTYESSSYLPSLGELHNFHNIETASWVNLIPHSQILSFMNLFQRFFLSLDILSDLKVLKESHLKLLCLQFCEFCDFVRLEHSHSFERIHEVSSEILNLVGSALIFPNLKKFRPYFFRVYQSCRGIQMDLNTWLSSDPSNANSALEKISTLQELNSLLKDSLSEETQFVVYECLLQEFVLSETRSDDSDISYFASQLCSFFVECSNKNEKAEKTSLYSRLTFISAFLSNLPLFSQWMNKSHGLMIFEFLVYPPPRFEKLCTHILTQSWLYEMNISSCIIQAICNGFVQLSKFGMISGETFVVNLLSTLPCSIFRSEDYRLLWNSYNRVFGFSVQLFSMLARLNIHSVKDLFDVAAMDSLFLSQSSRETIVAVFNQICSLSDPNEYESLEFGIQMFHAWVNMKVQSKLHFKEIIELFVSLVEIIKLASQNTVNRSFEAILKLKMDVLNYINSVFSQISFDGHDLCLDKLSAISVNMKLLTEKNLNVLITFLLKEGESSGNRNFIGKFISKSLCDANHNFHFELLDLAAKLDILDSISSFSWVNSCSGIAFEKCLNIIIEKSAIKSLKDICLNCVSDKKFKILNNRTSEIISICSQLVTDKLFLIDEASYSSLEENFEFLSIILKNASNLHLNEFQISLCFGIISTSISMLNRHAKAIIPFQLLKSLQLCCMMSIRYRYEQIYDQMHLFMQSSLALLKLYVEKLELSLQSVNQRSHVLIEHSDRMARIFEELSRAHNRNALKLYISFFLSSVITVLVSHSIPNKHKLALFKGFYFLLDSCDSREYQRIYTSFDNDPARVLFKKLCSDYSKLHKFTGHV